jgi:catechol 2,3-dioxygenase-like lactoylglutathione lyase family enzyme
VNIALDHVGFVGPDLAALRATFVRLGFSLTEPRPLMRRDASTGELVPLDQWSCHIVLEQGYVELSAVQTTSAAHHLAAYAPAEAAIKILALATDDVVATHAQLVSSGIRATAPQWAAREIHYGSRRGEARFHWFMVDPLDAPEGLLCFVNNATPELVYQPEVTGHDLGAIGLIGTSIVMPTSRDARATAARYARVLGRDSDAAEYARVGDAEGFSAVLELSRGELWVGDCAAATLRWGAAVARTSAAMAVMTVQVKSLEQAARCLTALGTPFERANACLVLPPEAAAGAIVCLDERARVSSARRIPAAKTF